MLDLNKSSHRGLKRVLRGSSWKSNARNCRSANPSATVGSRSVSASPCRRAAALLVYLLAFGVALPCAAQTLPPPSPSRLGLVIGNSAYEVGRLRNPVNDADDMAATLRELGFEVILKKDVGHQEMEEAIRAFGKRLHQQGGVGLFYFAGHGVQVDGVNYLLPVSSDLRSQVDVRYKTVSLPLIVETMGEAAVQDRFNLIILDACRNNPFPPSSRSSSQGLAATRAPIGTLIAYAAGPGAVAEDGGEGDRNGRFTKHLLRTFRVRGLSIEQIIKLTREAVVAETGGRQVPWSESSLVGEFVPQPVRRKEGSVGPSPRIELERVQAVGALEITVGQEGAQIRVGTSFEDTSTEAGSLILRNVPIGKYWLEVSKKGFRTIRKRVTVELGETTSVWAELKQTGDRRLDRVGGVEIAVRYIRGDSFVRGSPMDEYGRDDDEISEQVTLTRDFWIMESEVTQAQWKAVMGTNPSHFADCGGNCPVEQVSWHDAVAFANKLSELSGWEQCYQMDCSGTAGEDLTCGEVTLAGLGCEGWRLPTEAEWEYAARAGTNTPFWTGGKLSTTQANYNGHYPYRDSPKGEYRQKPVPAASLPANGWGLHDVHGNVYEWVWDWFGSYASFSAVDPVGPSAGVFRVIRGGSWGDLARYCRSADRNAHPPDGRNPTVGFRLVRTASE